MMGENHAVPAIIGIEQIRCHVGYRRWPSYIVAAILPATARGRCQRYRSRRRRDQASGTGRTDARRHRRIGRLT
jgi:hypothetical protein